MTSFQTSLPGSVKTADVGQGRHGPDRVPGEDGRVPAGHRVRSQLPTEGRRAVPQETFISHAVSRR